MPPWARPKSADTMNSDGSESDGRKRSSDSACSAELIRKVGSGPIRSTSQPKPRRLTTPAASITDSISAPRAVP